MKQSCEKCICVRCQKEFGTDPITCRYNYCRLCKRLKRAALYTRCHIFDKKLKQNRARAEKEGVDVSEI